MNRYTRVLDAYSSAPKGVVQQHLLETMDDRPTYKRHPRRKFVIRADIITFGSFRLHMHGIDPYEPTDPTFECPICGARSNERGECDACSATLLNISVARE